MTQNTLSPTLSQYFQAGNGRDVQTFLSCFAPDAVVEDEDQTHRGPEEIAHWFQDTRSRYDFTAEVLRFTEEGDATVVTCKVTGTFPGSPVELDYRFTLEDGLINNVRIA